MRHSIRINFSKMQALGNDFMVISTKDQNFSLSSSQIQALSHRHLGVGFDQLLLIKPPRSPDHDFFYQIYNADGQEVGQCGNGARCVAKYIYTHLKPQTEIRLATFSLNMRTKVLNADEFALILNGAKFHPQDIPLLGFKQQASYTLNLEQTGPISFHAVNVGNPHAVIVLPHLDDQSIQQLGPKLETHPAFPEGCNVNFVQIVDANNIKLRVWERGCGETMACGSGALASASIARKFYHLAEKIEVHLPGGKLSILCADPEQSLEQIGPAVEVYQGQISLGSSLE